MQKTYVDIFVYMFLFSSTPLIFILFSSLDVNVCMCVREYVYVL